MLRSSRHALLAIPLLLAVAGCSKVEDSPVAPTSTVTVSAVSLPRIDGDAHYAVWFSHAEGKPSLGGKPAHGDHHYVKIGAFKLGPNGEVVGVNGGAASFAVPSDINAQLLIDAIVTVEKDGGLELEPTARLASGVFTGTSSKGVARLAFSDDESFGDVFADAEGSVVLDAPTSADTLDFARGIWLAKPNGTSVDAASNLPVMPISDETDEWRYEMWLMHKTGAGGTEYISLGRFLNPAAKDLNGAGATAGPDAAAAYPFPGQDFLATGSERTLNDGSYGVAISIEPYGAQLRSPYLTLLKLETIPTSLTRLAPQALTRVTPAPYGMTVTVDR